MQSLIIFALVAIAQAEYMRCYISGEFSYEHTKLGCNRADLPFNGFACWARKTSDFLTQDCDYFAPRFCPKTIGKYYSCHKN